MAQIYDQEFVNETSRVAVTIQQFRQLNSLLREHAMKFIVLIDYVIEYRTRNIYLMLTKQALKIL